MDATQDLGWITEQLRGLAIPVEELHQDPANARLHNERNLQAIASSLNRFGQRKPVVVQRETRTVIAGNGTLEAARTLGWSHLAAVLVDDDPTTATGYAIADNRTAELAGWDHGVLASLLESVGHDLPSVELGFTEEELKVILEGSMVDMGDDTEGDGFAEGDQFKDADVIVIEIQVDSERFDNGTFRTDLIQFCEQMGLSYKAKAK